MCGVGRDKPKGLEHRWGICPAWPQGVVSSPPLEEGNQKLIIDGVIENQVFHQTTGLHQQFPHFLFPRAPFIIFPFGLHVMKDFVKQTNCTYWVITNTFPHFLIKRVCMCVREREREREICNWTHSLWYHDYHDLNLLIIFQKYPRCHQQPI